MDLGSGDDSIRFNGNGYLLNNGTIRLGAGIDSITGINARLTNTGTIDFGEGNNNISAFSLSNTGTLSFGSGNDSVTTTSSLGINNSSTVLLGGGNDIVNCISSTTNNFGQPATSARPAGLINFGDGNDTLIGYGRGLVDGGTGIDRILLPTSAYRINVFSTYCTIAQLQPNGLPSPNFMTAYGFELIGSSTNPNNTITPANGSILIGADGSISILA
jgi:hypothetical protein